MEKYYNENYYNANTILKFLRKVLNEINKSYVDSGMRTAFLMKRYIEKYKIDTEHGHEHVLLCMLKDIGLFYMDGAVPPNDPALAAASSYAFLHQCSPLDENARPLLFYKARYMEDVNNFDYDLGLLMTLLDHVSLYIYQRKDVDEIEEILRADKKRKAYNPDQVKKVIKLLKDSPDIIEKLNSESELYVYETSRYISLANYGTDTLGEFLDTTSFMFEFHNHETMAHTVTTAQIAYDLAIDCKLTESTARAIEIAGKVHDIGKIRVPLEILCYPGKLSGEALDEMQMHAKYTKEIIEGCFSYVIVEIASRHHEKLDGSGYPLGITKKDLTSADKVLAVADICSALYCKRSYKEAFTPEKIQSILLSDAKAGKLDERIVNHLIDDYDRIMANAKAVEDRALKKYDTMKDEYEALANSPALRNVFGESEEVDSDRPESVAADETEEYISGVINYRKNEEALVEEQIIYVDEDGNEIDYNPEEYQNGEEATFEVEESHEEDPLEEYNKEEMGDVPLEEIKKDDDSDEEEPTPRETKEEIDDEFDAFLESIPEKEVTDEEEKPIKKPFVPKVPLKHPAMSFDPFKEDIDPVFNEPILPKEEKVQTKEEIDDEFDAFLESIPEKEALEDKEEKDSFDPFTNENDVPDFKIEEEETIEEPKSIEEIMEEAFEEEKDSTLDDEENIEADFVEESQEFVEEQEEIDDSALDVEDTSKEQEDDYVTSYVDENEFEDEEEVDDTVSSAIDSKYDSDEEVDGSDSFDEESIMEKEESKEDDYVTSYVDEEDFDSVVDEEPQDAIIPDESKYDNDPEEEIDDSTGNIEDTSKEQEESKEDNYVTSYVDEDEFEEESKEEEKPEETLKVDSHEDDYVTSYVDEEEFEDNSSSEKEEEKVEKIPSKSIEEDDSLDDEEDEEDEEDDDDDFDEEDEEEIEEDEEEDKDPKHKKFFSNDIYRKMFTYNPNKKKK